ncbi:helix-turn-helix domain-containing protein [Streptomyces sp. NBC_01275]|uniref:ArsR/SmtB family transcription factor n=1 Tax=Streptomyces sp. NBC_01275 TaxID=2903807 RepID=UPI00224E77AE|nr:metalloregulator ArsR/SmtB family transcription factor [Streptomyces sp. NBC_01275]MCX4762490.1 helix-turn-helix domain-containing protein [Streptomyces sp. NBC_01275]
MTEQEEPKQRRLDARALRGLAHPLRMQMLNALRQRGPATASQLAAQLGESSGATSYHLRQLAAHGFVEDAPEHGKGRERWWRAVDEGLVFDSSEFEGAGPEVRGAAEMFLHEVANNHARELSTWLSTRDRWSEPWSRSTDMSDMTLRLTPALAGELVDKMHELIDSYRDRVPDDEVGAERVRIHSHLFPITTD